MLILWKNVLYWCFFVNSFPVLTINFCSKINLFQRFCRVVVEQSYKFLMMCYRSYLFFGRQFHNNVNEIDCNSTTVLILKTSCLLLWFYSITIRFEQNFNARRSYGLAKNFFLWKSYRGVHFLIGCILRVRTSKCNVQMKRKWNRFVESHNG